jgi:hypothetical protein
MRHLPSIVASSLLFGFVGTPTVTMLMLAATDAESGKPGSAFSGIDGFVLIAILCFVAVFIAPPAFVIGVIAGILRIHIRSILVFAGVMSAMAGLATLGLTGAVSFDLLSGRSIIAATSATVFGCSLLLWRNRPWLISPR